MVGTTHRVKPPLCPISQPSIEEGLWPIIWHHVVEIDWKPRAEAGCAGGDESNPGNENTDKVPGARRWTDVSLERSTIVTGEGIRDKTNVGLWDTQSIP